MKQKSIAAMTGLALVLAAFICTGCLYDVVDLPDPVLLVEPYITVQPENRAYTVGAAAADTLSVTTEDWQDSDGTLSWQWYTFDSVFAYLSNEVTPIGGDSDTLTLPPLNTGAGSRNYFFVEVTNTNSKATNRRSATVRSEVAVISFNTSGSPAIPVITRQPTDTQARFGRPVSPLSVRATVNAPAADIGELFFQWYSVDIDENGDIKDTDGDGIPDATEVDGEIASSFTPVASALGDGYYFVKVTHTVGRVEAVPPVLDANGNEITPGVPGSPGVSSVEYSIPATVNILRGLRAGAPDILTEPKPALYFADQSPVPLTVDAISPDDGTLSFEWYSHTSPASSGGKAIATTTETTTGIKQPDGTWKSSYTPDFSADGDISNFYYVIVTNTNTNVEGAVRATATTRAVNVRRQTAATPDNSNATLIINSSQRFQYIRGYGGMEVAWANFPETYPEDTELQYDPNKLGYNILRIMLPVSNVNIDVAMDDLVNVTRRRPHYYDNVKIVNKYDGYVLASPWSPPKEWKSNNSINGGGILRHEYYKDYAAYLKSYAMHMNNRGAPIYAISIQNEPNYTAGYDGCEWTGNEMRDFFLQAGRFTEGVRGWGGGRQIPRVLTMNGESANNVDINFPAIDNASAYANIDLFARHVYGDRDTNLWASRPKVRKVYADDEGKDVWMTEHNINSANAAGYYNDSKWDYIWKFMNDIDRVMRLNNENAFVWWASKRFYSMVGDGQYGTPAGQALPRGWGLSHYAKYTIGTTRIGFDLSGTMADGTTVITSSNVNANYGANDMDSTSVRITAYAKFEDGLDEDKNPIKVPVEISLVMWTPTANTGSGGYDIGTIQINMPAGFKIGGVTGIQSYKVNETTNTYQAPYDVAVGPDRDRAFVRLERSRIKSVKFTKQEQE